LAAIVKDQGVLNSTVSVFKNNIFARTNVIAMNVGIIKIIRKSISKQSFLPWHAMHTASRKSKRDKTFLKLRFLV
jgi:hypothetical protein